MCNKTLFLLLLATAGISAMDDERNIPTPANIARGLTFTTAATAHAAVPNTFATRTDQILAVAICIRMHVLATTATTSDLTGFRTLAHELRERIAPHSGAFAHRIDTICDHLRTEYSRRIAPAASNNTHLHPRRLEFGPDRRELA